MSSKPKNAPNPFDPAALRMPEALVAGGGAQKQLIVLNVQKPPRQAFVRVNPDLALRNRMALLELKDERETYAVTPSVGAAIPGEVKVVDLRLAVTLQGLLFLWPVPIPSADRADTAWSITQRAAAERAENAWVRMIANMHAQSYDVYEAQSTAAEPAWPDKTMQELLELAFGNGRLIEDMSHPVIQRLLGRA